MNILRKFGNVVFVVLAIVFVGPGRLAKWLNKKVYEKFIIGIFHALAAMVSGWFLGTGAAAYVAATHEPLGLPYGGWLDAHFFTGGYGSFSAGVVGVIAFFLTAVYLYPAAWLTVLKPLWTMCDKIHGGIEKFLKVRGESIALGITRVGRFLPFSAKGWNILLRKERKSWFVTLVNIVTYPTVVLGSLYMGYQIAMYGFGLFGISSILGILGTAAGGVVALAATVAVCTTLTNLLRYGKVATQSIFIGVAAAIAGAPYVAALVAGFGGGLIIAGAALLVAFSLFIGYLFPLINLVLSNEFLKWVADRVEPICEATYDHKEADAPFAHLFHQVLNILVTVALGIGTVVLGNILLPGIMAQPLFASIPVALIVVFFAYNIVGKVLDWNGGNFVIGATSALAASISLGLAYKNAGLVFGGYGGIFVGVVVALFIGFIAFPLLYLGLQWLATRKLTKGATETVSAGLVKAHKYSFEKMYEPFIKWVNEAYETVTTWTYNTAKQVYDYGYKDTKTANYQVMILHIANIGIALALGYGVFYLTRNFAAAHAVWGPALAYTGVALTGALSYLLTGKALLKGGAEAVGVMVSLIAGFAVGAVTLPLVPYGIALASMIGLATAFLSFVLAFPLVYSAIRFLLDPLFTSWLKPLLDRAYAFGWKHFGKVWDKFVAAFKRFMTFLKPYFNWFIVLVAAGWRRVSAAWDKARAIFDGMFGGRKKA